MLPTRATSSNGQELYIYYNMIDIMCFWIKRMLTWRLDLVVRGALLSPVPIKLDWCEAAVGISKTFMSQTVLCPLLKIEISQQAFLNPRFCICQRGGRIHHVCRSVRNSTGTGRWTPKEASGSLFLDLILSIAYSFYSL